MRVFLATVLMALGGLSLHAQAPLTTAQLQAKITALEQENARLQRLADICTPPTPIVAPTSGHGQTLGEAAAQAAAIHHEWAASANTIPRFDPAAQPAPVMISPAEELSPVPAIAAAQHDEPYWKDRMRALRVQLGNDQTYQAAAKVRIASLQVDLSRTRTLLEEVTVKKTLLEAQTELSRLTAAVTNDTRAVADLEIEAHRASVPPGWLVIK